MLANRRPEGEPDSLLDDLEDKVCGDKLQWTTIETGLVGGCLAL